MGGAEKVMTPENTQTAYINTFTNLVTDHAIITQICKSSDHRGVLVSRDRFIFRKGFEWIICPFSEHLKHRMTLPCGIIYLEQNTDRHGKKYSSRSQVSSLNYTIDWTKVAKR